MGVNSSGTQSVHEVLEMLDYRPYSKVDLNIMKKTAQMNKCQSVKEYLSKNSKVLSSPAAKLETASL